MRTILPLLLVLALATVAWVVVGVWESSGDVAFEEASVPGPVPQGTDSGPEPPGPGDPNPRGPREPDGPLPRVSVLPDGPLPPLPENGAQGGPGTAVIPRPQATGRDLTGADVVRAVGEKVYVRAHTAHDLDRLRALSPEPDWAGEELPLEHIFDHWRRDGFMVDHAGHVVIVWHPESREE